MQRMLLVTAAFSIIVGIFVGYSIGKWSGDKKLAALQAEKKSGTPGLTGPAPMAPMAPSDIRQISATIKSIEGNKLIVTAMSVPGMGGAGETDERTVTVSDSTKITMMKTKDPAVFQKEMEEFQKNYTPPAPVTPGTVPPAPIAGSVPPSMPPMSMERIDISLSDLKVGQIVHIGAAENIKDAKSFTAVTIDANDSAVAGPAPMAPMMAPPAAAPQTAPAPAPQTAPAPAQQ